MAVSSSNEESGRSTYGIVLKIDEPVASAFCVWSEQLGQIRPSAIRLTTDIRFPHVTIAHFRSSLNVAVEIAKELETEGVGAAFSVELDGSYVVEFRGSITAGQVVVPNERLTTTHFKLVRICDARGASVVSQAGESYWPHVTASYWNEQPDNALPSIAIDTNEIAATLVLAEMGEHGTAQRIIEVS